MGRQASVRSKWKIRLKAPRLIPASERSSHHFIPLSLSTSSSSITIINQRSGPISSSSVTGRDNGVLEEYVVLAIRGDGQCSIAAIRMTNLPCLSDTATSPSNLKTKCIIGILWIRSYLPTSMAPFRKDGLDDLRRLPRNTISGDCDAVNVQRSS